MKIDWPTACSATLTTDSAGGGRNRCATRPIPPPPLAPATSPAGLDRRRRDTVYPTVPKVPTPIIPAINAPVLGRCRHRPAPLTRYRLLLRQAGLAAVSAWQAAVSRTLSGEQSQTESTSSYSRTPRTTSSASLSIAAELTPGAGCGFGLVGGTARSLGPFGFGGFWRLWIHKILGRSGGCGGLVLS